MIGILRVASICTRCNYVFPYNPSYTVLLAGFCWQLARWHAVHLIQLIFVFGQGLAAILARFDVTHVDKGLACVPFTSHKKEPHPKA